MSEYDLPVKLADLAAYCILYNYFTLSGEISLGETIRRAKLSLPNEKIRHSRSMKNFAQ